MRICCWRSATQILDGDIILVNCFLIYELMVLYYYFFTDMVILVHSYIEAHKLFYILSKLTTNHCILFWICCINSVSFLWWFLSIYFSSFQYLQKIVRRHNLHMAFLSWRKNVFFMQRNIQIRAIIIWLKYESVPIELELASQMDFLF